MSRIGANIKFLRGTQGWSQQQFAVEFGMTRAAVGSYEEGRAEPKIPAVLQIAERFELSLEQLLDQELTEWPVPKTEKTEAPAVQVAGSVEERLDRIEAKLDQLLNRES